MVRFNFGLGWDVYKRFQMFIVILLVLVLLLDGKERFMAMPRGLLQRVKFKVVIHFTFLLSNQYNHKCYVTCMPLQLMLGHRNISSFHTDFTSLRAPTWWSTSFD